MSETHVRLIRMLTERRKMGHLALRRYLRIARVASHVTQRLEKTCGGPFSLTALILYLYPLFPFAPLFLPSPLTPPLPQEL